ncbi:flippase [Methylibium sp.]|uniref:flippase n=1 Tax=Methylibium sp. TaxID=2067992 RepID=UPI003D0CB4FE
MSLQKIGRNSAWNLFGQVAPVFLALGIIPLLLKHLGADRYGFLTLVWVLIGYVGVFDLGVGRAMTRVVAERLGAGDRPAAEALAQSAMSFLLILGGVFAIALLCTAEIVVTYLSLPAHLSSEGTWALRILAMGLPFVMLTSGYRGCLEAFGRFPTVNMIRVGMGFFTYLAPLMAVMVSPRLEVMVGAVVLMRVAANIVHRWACRRDCGFVMVWRMPDRARLLHLLGFGGWITVSDIVSPLMNSLDRLIIGGFVPVATVGYYATAYDIVNKVVMMPYSVMSAAFPVVAGCQDQTQARSLYALLFKCVVIAVLPVLLGVVVFAEVTFRLWLGPDFSKVATPVAQILAVGLFFNCAAQAPAMLILSRGKPKWMALSHLCEVPVFIGVLFALTREYGIIGTAIAWSLRAAVDAVILFGIVEVKLLQGGLGFRALFVSTALATLAFAATLSVSGLEAKAISLGSCLVLLLPLFWFGLLDQEERPHVIDVFRRRREASA